MDEKWGRHVATADHVAVPHVVFTDPEIAAVGKTEAQAREAGLRIQTVEYDLGNVAGASLHADGYTGRAKIVIDEDRGVIVGATFVGQDVAELLHSATIAIVGGPDRSLVACRPVLPYDQRSLVAAARNIRSGLNLMKGDTTT